MKLNDCTPEGSPSYSCADMLRAVADAQYAIGGKWRLQIVIALADRSKRFNELQRQIEGISARVLSNELKELELLGFIRRKVDAKATPVLVEYQLSEYSHSLNPVVQAMISWGAHHRDLIRQHKV